MFERPKKQRRAYPVILWSALLVLALFGGCGKKPPAAVFPDTTPTTALLADSQLHQFATHLKAMPEDQRAAAVQQFLLEHPVSPITEGNRLAGILWYGKAQTVFINGDLQRAWTRPEPLDAIACGESTLFYCLRQAPPDARLDYLLNVDGQNTTDPRNPRVTPSGFGPHSEIIMPAFQPNPARRFRDDIAHGTLATLSFTNRIAPRLPRTLKVYEPAAYDGSTRLPTLYVYDGLEALDYMAYTNVLDNLIAEGKIRPVLVVFVSMLPEDGQLIPDKLTTLANIVCDEIVPVIDGDYPTLHDSSNRAIAGISIWGHLALMTALSHPEVFLLAAGQSSTVTDSLLKVLRQATGNAQARPPFRFYQDVGNYDLVAGGIDGLPFLQANQRLRAELEQCGVPCQFQAVNDGHQWANWRERTDALLRYFFPPATNPAAPSEAPGPPR